MWQLLELLKFVLFTRFPSYPHTNKRSSGYHVRCKTYGPASTGSMSTPRYYGKLQRLEAASDRPLHPLEVLNNNNIKLEQANSKYYSTEELVVTDGTNFYTIDGND